MGSSFNNTDLILQELDFLELNEDPVNPFIIREYGPYATLSRLFKEVYADTFTRN